MVESVHDLGNYKNQQIITGLFWRQMVDRFEIKGGISEFWDVIKLTASTLSLCYCFIDALSKEVLVILSLELGYGICRKAIKNGNNKIKEQILHADHVHSLYGARVVETNTCCRSNAQKIH